MVEIVVCVGEFVVVVVGIIGDCLMELVKVVFDGVKDVSL